MAASPPANLDPAWKRWVEQQVDDHGRTIGRIETNTAAAEQKASSTTGHSISVRNTLVDTRDQLAAKAGPPSAPVNLVAVSAGAWDALGNPAASVTLTWDAVTVPPQSSPDRVTGDGFPVELQISVTVATYEVWSKEGAGSSNPSDYKRLSAATSNTLTASVEAGKTYSFIVRASTEYGVFGDFSAFADVTTTSASVDIPAPSTPMVSSGLSMVTVEWDGTFTSGTTPPYFRYVDVQFCTTVGGTYTSSGQTLSSFGGIAIPGIAVGTTLYFKLQAVDSAGHATGLSAASAPVTVTAVLLGDLDQTVKDYIQTSAHGGNTITYSLNDPSGAGTEGDTWFKRNVSGVIIGQWGYISGAWVAQTVDNAVIANLDAGKITTGELDADRIGANTITGDKILAGEIDSSLLSATAIDGKTITGATVQTSATANTGLKIDSSGLSAYAPDGTKTVGIDAATGALNATSGTFSGTVASSAGTTAGSATATVDSGQIVFRQLGSSDYVQYSPGQVFQDSSIGKGTFGISNKGGGDLTLSARQADNSGTADLLLRPGVSGGGGIIGSNAIHFTSINTISPNILGQSDNFPYQIGVIPNTNLGQFYSTWVNLQGSTPIGKIGLHGTVNADPTPARNGDYVWNGTAWSPISLQVSGSMKRASTAKTFAGSTWTVNTDNTQWAVDQPVIGVAAMSSGQWTAPIDGWYDVQAGIQLDAAVTAIFVIKKNSTSADSTGAVVSGTAKGVAGFTSLSLAKRVRLSAGNTLVTAIYVDAAAAWTTSDVDTSYFGIRWVEPLR